MLTRRKLAYPLFGVCVLLSNAAALQTMYGSVEIKNTTLTQPVKIVGMGKIRDTVVDHDLRVFGFLKSRNSHFLSNLHATGSDLSLCQDQVEGDVHITNYVKRPRLYLDQSKISGKVIFHGAVRGRVVMDKGSVIAQGIENGDVV